MRIIKTKDWYDPEGLNIPSNAEVVFEGSYEACREELEDLRSKFIVQFADRDDIDVYAIKTKKEIVEKIPAPGGGYYIKSKELPQSEYFEIYYSSAICKVYYSIVK